METNSHICGNCENANSPLVCASCVNRNLNEKYKLLNALKRDHDSLHKRLDEKLKSNREAVEQQQWRLMHAKKIAQLKETLRLKQNQLCRQKSELEEKTNELNNNKNLLAEASEVLKKNRTKQLKLHSDLICTQNSRLKAVQAELLKNQSVAIKQLCKIFPLGKSKDEGSSGEYFYDTICNVPLPRGLNPNSVTQQELAVSLGYMVQLLNLVVRYLYAPLLLDSGFAGSCSHVWERASYPDSQRKQVYPLFFPRQNKSTHASKECSIAFDVSSILEIDLQKAMSKDVQKGIYLLKKAVACVTTYYCNSFSIPLPTDISTFEAFEKILKFISLRDKDAAAFVEETKLRCRRQGLLLESSDPGISSRNLQESEHCKDQQRDRPNRMTSTLRDMNGRAKDDGREVVEVEDHVGQCSQIYRGSKPS